MKITTIIVDRNEIELSIASRYGVKFKSFTLSSSGFKGVVKQ
jgi:hypothetical protein